MCPGIGVGISPCLRSIKPKTTIIPDSSIRFAVNFEGNGNDYLNVNNPASTTGVTYGTGKVGQCATFNGSANIKYTSINYPSGSNIISGSFWIRTTQVNGYVFGIADSSGTATTKVFYAQIRSGILYIGMQNTSNTTFEANTTVTINDGAWHNISFTKTLGTSTLNIFLDNVQKTASPSFTSRKTQANNFAFGQIGDWVAGGTYIGDLDAFAMFGNITPSPATAFSTYLYNSGNGVQPPYVL